MSELIAAWDKNTGEKLPQLVPRNWVGHPRLGKNLTATEPAEAPEETSTKKLPHEFIGESPERKEK